MSEGARGPALRTALVGVVLLLAAAALLGILRCGQSVPAPAGLWGSAGAPTPAAAPPDHPLPSVLLALAAVIAAGLVLGRAVAFLGQPPVIGEVIAGILLGPSLLGERLSGLLLPPSAAPFLALVGQLGILLYMFAVGLELREGRAGPRTATLLATSLASMALPFLLGAALARVLYGRFAGGGTGFTGFALFLGVSLSITAFPVLARLLADRRMLQTELGSLALRCAAIGDVVAWCLLASAVGVATSRAGSGLGVTLGAAAYLLAMVAFVRPLAHRLVAGWGDEPLSPARGATVFVALLLSAFATERIGIHAIFGAFLLGAILPRDSVVARTLARQLQPVVTALLLPAFFALTGMRTRIDLLSGAESWLICVGIVLVATLGKFGGTYAAARLTGVGARDAAALGMLMNTRGLIELIVLNIGLDLRVLSPTLFAMMVVMALATTMMTAPALQRLLPDRQNT